MKQHAILVVEFDNDELGGTPIGVGYRVSVMLDGHDMGPGFVRRLAMPVPGEMPFTVHVENRTGVDLGFETEACYDAADPNVGPFDVRLVVRPPKASDENAEDLRPIDGLGEAALAVIGVHEIVKSLRRGHESEAPGAITKDLDDAIERMKRAMANPLPGVAADEHAAMKEQIRKRFGLDDDGDQGPKVH